MGIDPTGCEESQFYGLSFEQVVASMCQPEKFFDTVLLKFEFPKKLTCPLGELSTEFTSLIAKSTSPTTFFARCPTSVIIKPKPKSSGSGSGSNILNAFINCFTGTH